MPTQPYKSLIRMLILSAGLIFGTGAWAEPPVNPTPAAQAHTTEVADLTKIQNAINTLEQQLDKQTSARDEEDEAEQKTLVPIVNVITVIGGPLLLMAFILVLGYRKQQMRMQQQIKLLDTLIAAGRDIPTELFTPRGEEKPPQHYLHSGLRYGFLGLGWLLAFSLLGKREIGYLGLIVLSFGASQLMIWKLSHAASANK
ncbi:MAG: hypothetical protein RL497_1703 [Pseudomonadota bacterium]